jgi:hypothetical protein
MIVTSGIMYGIYWWATVYSKRKRWKVRIYNIKTDGMLHLVGTDTLEERTKNWGTKSFFYFKKRRKVATPPPDELVDKLNGKDWVDYIQIERQLFPASKKINSNINIKDTEINLKLQKYYDTVIKNIYNSKKKPGIDTHIYFPLKKVLSVDSNFKPIPYDAQMTASRQVEINNEFFKKKTNFWDKYGAAVMVVLIGMIVFLAIYLSYNYLSDVLEMYSNNMATVSSSLKSIAEQLANSGKPPV